MAFIEAPTTFYLGRRYDPEKGQMADEVVYYDSRDLTTHAVVVGMTGSGKTGLCISLLEEAALDGVPTIAIDPKGDITNLLLAFPGLTPQEFAPWINPSDAQRAGLSVEEYSSEVAQTWREGLAKWGISPQRVQNLVNSAQFSIYTPGSEAGLPINILASFEAPRNGWVGNEEFHREQISGITRGLLALVGKQADPGKDREHVLISNIIEEAWKTGRDLTLEDIILQVQNPPFPRLGVFDVNTFFPEKDRFKLARELNNVIASPTIQTWVNGESIDMRSLLYTPEGKPRVSIFYLSHLTEAEQTFMITLLLENLLSWMHTLGGTTSLRAILYFDEVFGHFPPAPRNPPTKDPLLRILKTARAFGIGTIVATQNPGDLDYRGLSNAGTWWIGKLQTDNDKKRLLGGMESAATADSRLDIKKLDNLISGLAPRVFLMHNIHDDDGPTLLHTRWAMSYLRGPLTRTQIRTLMDPQRAALTAGPGGVAGSQAQAAAGMAAAAGAVAAAGTGVAGSAPAAAGSGAASPIQPRATPIGVSFMRPAIAEPPRAAGGTPKPGFLPGEAPAPGATPPPVLPEASPGTAGASSEPPAPPESTGASARPSFLDRLSRESAQGGPAAAQAGSRASGTPEAAKDEPFAPAAPFQFVKKPPAGQAPLGPPPPEDPASPAMTEAAATPAPGASSFWTAPEADAPPASQPAAPAPDAAPIPDQGTMPVGMGYSRPNRGGTMTEAGPALPEGYSQTPPPLPSSIPQFFLPPLINTGDAIRAYEAQAGVRGAQFAGAQIVYRPVFLAQIHVRFLDRKTGADGDQRWAFHVPDVGTAGLVRWNDYQAQPIPPEQIDSQPYGQAGYGVLPPGLVDPKRIKALRDEAHDYVARSAQLDLFYNPHLKIYSKVGEDLRDFQARVRQIAREQLEQEAAQLAAKYNQQVQAMELKLDREQRQLDASREAGDELKREDLYTTGEAVMSLLKGYTAYTLSRMSRARRYKKQAQYRSSLNEAQINSLLAEIEAKENELQTVLIQAKDRWTAIANQNEEYAVTPLKKDVAVEVFGLGWVPQWYMVLDGAAVMWPAFPQGLQGE
jgi:hypothetical protein